MAHRTTFPPAAELIPGEGMLEATFKTSKGDFRVALFEEIAPNTVASFVGLATGKGEWTDPKTGQPGEGRFYDGVIFHRIIKGFVIQGGDRTGTGRSGPGYTFDDEPSDQAKHIGPGILSMANRGKDGGRGTNGSQFFVTLGATPHLDGRHTVFGEVNQEDIEVVEAIGAVPTGKGDRPIEDVVINTIEIERV